jgi:hypothetical protein
METTVGELKAFVCEMWSFEPMFLRIFHKDVPYVHAGSTLLGETGVMDGDILDFRHLKLDAWLAYISDYDVFVKEPRNGKLSHGKRLRESYESFQKWGFFKVYSKKVQEGNKIYLMATKFLQKNFYYLEKASNEYYCSKFIDQKPEISCKEISSNDPGSRAALLCHVKLENEIICYRVKTNHHAGTEVGVVFDFIDMRELFCYKLLELIGVGATIDFIPNTLGSKLVIYIGSKWINNFVPFRQAQNSGENVPTSMATLEKSSIQRALVQIQFLGCFLKLVDLHGDNMGMRDNRPVIIDFWIGNWSDVITKYYLNDLINVRSDYKQLLTECQEAERTKIGKDCVRQWDIMKKIDEANTVLQTEKLRFGSRNLQYKYDTESLDTFIKDLKKNIEHFMKNK